jgi:hypothetical protein
LRGILAQSEIRVDLIPFYDEAHSTLRLCGVSLALLDGQVCKSPGEYKAWLQNLGHEHVLTAFSSHGAVSSYRQAQIMP